MPRRSLVCQKRVAALKKFNESRFSAKFVDAEKIIQNLKNVSGIKRLPVGSRKDSELAASNEEVGPSNSDTSAMSNRNGNKNQSANALLHAELSKKSAIEIWKVTDSEKQIKESENKENFNDPRSQLRCIPLSSTTETTASRVVDPIAMRTRSKVDRRNICKRRIPILRDRRPDSKTQTKIRKQERLKVFTAKPEKSETRAPILYEHNDGPSCSSNCESGTLVRTDHLIGGEERVAPFLSINNVRNINSVLSFKENLVKEFGIKKFGTIRLSSDFSLSKRNHRSPRILVKGYRACVSLNSVICPNGCQGQNNSFVHKRNRVTSLYHKPNNLVSIVNKSVENSDPRYEKQSTVDHIKCLKGVSVFHVYNKTRMKDDLFYIWLSNLGLLSKRLPCDCTRSFIVVANNPKSSDQVPYFWRCSICAVEINVIENSFFTKFQIPPKEVLLISYFWSKGYYTLTEIQLQMRDSYPIRDVSTLIACFDVFSAFCSNYLRYHCSIGGPKKTVEFGSKMLKSYTRDRRICEYQWILAGVERDTKKCFIVTVDNADLMVVLSLIKRYICPGTKLVSNLWKTLFAINGIPPEYKSFCSKRDITLFVPPSMECTANLQHLWDRILGKKEEDGLCSAKIYASQIAWQSHFGGDDCFYHFWRQVSLSLNCIT